MLVLQCTSNKQLTNIPCHNNIMINDYCQWDGQRYIIKQAQEVTLKKQTSFKSINISYNLDLLVAIMLNFTFVTIIIMLYVFVTKNWNPLSRRAPPAGCGPRVLDARVPRRAQARAKQDDSIIIHNCIILKISNYASLRFIYYHLIKK